MTSISEEDAENPYAEYDYAPKNNHHRREEVEPSIENIIECIKSGNLAAIKRMDRKSFLWPKKYSTALNFALKYDQKYIAKYLTSDKKLIKKTIKACCLYAQPIYLSRLKDIKQECFDVFDPLYLPYTAQGGSIKVIDFLKKHYNGCITAERFNTKGQYHYYNMAQIAAFYGHYKLVKHLNVKYGFEIDEKVRAAALKGGKKEVAQQIYDNFLCKENKKKYLTSKNEHSKDQAMRKPIIGCALAPIPLPPNLRFKPLDSNKE